MKRIYLYAAMMMAGFCLTACDEDYTDWADPQTNDQEETVDAITASFSVSSVDLEGASAGDLVEVASYVSSSAEDASFTGTNLTIDGSSVDFTCEDGIYYVTASTLDNLVRETYGSRASVTRSFTIKVSGAVIVDEQGISASSDEMTLTVTPPPTPEEDANGYYLLGGFVGNDWSLTSPIWMENQGDGIYTATVTTSSSECWYKFYEGSYYDSSDWDVVNQGEMGCAENGDQSLTNYVVWSGDGLAANGVQTPVIPAEGTFVITLDIVNMIYSVVSVEPEIWYLVGGCIGDGSWGTGSADNVGVSLYPLAYVSDGVCAYTGYFTTDGFKLIKEVDSWDYQWGYSDGYVKNDGSSGNLWVDEAGYYTVTLDYRNDVLTIEPYTGTVTDYSQMGISGDFNSWGFEQIENATGTTHLWRFEFSSESDTTLKFLTDSSWSSNWGSDTFPSGTGVSNGANIPVTAGSYVVIFNDIDGGYTFVAK